MRKAMIASMAAVLLFVSWQASASHGVISPRDPSEIVSPRDPAGTNVVSPRDPASVLLNLVFGGVFA